MPADRSSGDGARGFRFAAWAAAVAALSVVFSLGLACAAPLAAVAVLAGRLPRQRQALALVGVAWLTNQAVGYGILGYPRTWNSVGWGLAMGMAALLATVAVRAWMQRGLAEPAGLAAAFVPASAVVLAGAVVLAFAIDQAVLFAATALLASGEAAFSGSVVLRIFAIHVLATALMLALHRLATAARLISAARPATPAHAAGTEPARG